MAHYFGVRHLSPACAFYVTQFLDKCNPKTVLIEGPSDLNDFIAPMCSMNSYMPVAILAYSQQAPVKTVLWPFAEFSPEYQAMMWAVKNNVPVKFCDLPSSCVLALKETESDSEEISIDEKSEPKFSVYDYIKENSGMDNDYFWEYTFEHSQNYDDFISAVEEYGKSIREFSENSEHNQLREAFMRQVIDETEKSGVESDKIAVITGAFHTYGLKNVPYSDDDKKRTKKLPSIDCKSTLMPYSYYKLSSHSGYGAGSKAPAYYEILWNNRLKNSLSDTPAEYLSRIAEYQREHGFSASSAEVIEALRLAETLSAMRGGTMPNLDDLHDASITCLGHGSFGEISLAVAATEIGTKIGSLPEGTVCTSVQDDFMRQLKELKLERFRSAVSEQLELDLRENLRVKSEKSAFLDLNRSFFLHRLKILNINFAETAFANQDNATWKEIWNLRWTPETEIEIVEASLNGDTIEQASQFVLNRALIESESLAENSQILSKAFLCGLTDTVKTAVSAVQRLASDCSDISETGNTIGTLSAIVRFGNIRRLSTDSLVPLMQQLFLRFCLGVSGASVCDKSAGENIVAVISKVNDSCLSHNFLDEELFVKTLSELADSDYVNPIISGFACAVLTERGKITHEKLSELVNRRLSKGTPAQEGALWFEGLSRKNRRSLISRLSLWEKLCNFIDDLNDDEFKPALVCLRRTFAEFSPSEKADIAENIGEILGLSPESASEFINAEITADEKISLDELDDFDFGDI